MSDLIRRLGADCSSISGSQCNAMRREAAAELERLIAERDTFYMDYRMKCDETTKAQAVEIERLTADNAALRADAGRYFTLELLAANGDVRVAFDEDGRVGVHLEEAAECADGSWFGDDLAAAVDAATRQITDTDAAIDASIDSARAKESGSVDPTKVAGA